jgi:hypothetical protein
MSLSSKRLASKSSNENTHHKKIGEYSNFSVFEFNMDTTTLSINTT